jgi:hypothetical protein
VGHTKQKVEGQAFQCVRQNFFNFWGCFFIKGGLIYFAQGMKRAREKRGGGGGFKNTFYRVIKSICKRKIK